MSDIRETSGPNASEAAERLIQLGSRLERIEVALRALLEQRTVQECYSTSDVARQLGKAEFTVREWCRHGRIRAEKRPCGRGSSKEWMISHDELNRLRSEGLLPLPRFLHKS